MQKIFLTIGGSDSSTGAGIQADIKVAEAIGIHVATVISCITAQNSKRVIDIEPISHDIFAKQLKAITEDFTIKVIKTSILVSIQQIDLIIELLKKIKDVIYICDPIVTSTTGFKLVSDDVIEYAKTNLYPLADILTPNLDEAKMLLGKYLDMDDVKYLARTIQKKYHCKNILVKGGHGYNKEVSEDCYYSDTSFTYNLSSPRYKLGKKIRGTGCTLSSAIASFLVLGFDINNSIVLAKSYITNAIKNSKEVTNSANFISKVNSVNTNEVFPKIFFDRKYYGMRFRSINKIGFYPIVDSVDKIPRLVKLGIKTIQLRIKSKDLEYVEEQISKAIKYQKKYSLQLFINDYYDLAIKYKAFGIHIGHEDLLGVFHKDENAIQKIIDSNIALGLSTHDYYELSVALAIHPSYIALGPIYETKTKKMKFEPQGLDKISEWLNIVNLPLVAIGGIKKQHIDIIAAKGVDGISVVSLIDEISDQEIIEIRKVFE